MPPPPQDTPRCELRVTSFKTSIIWQNMEVPSAGQQQAGGYRGRDLPGGVIPRQGTGGGAGVLSQGQPQEGLTPVHEAK